MNVLLYRFFLNKTDQLTLLENPDEKEDRVKMVKDVLTKPYHFKHRRSELGYVSERYEDNFIYGKFGKRSKLAKILSPEDGFKKEFEENWPYCDVFIRLDGDTKNGQTIAIERNTGIFSKPISPLQAWANKINETLSCEGYLLSIHPVTEEKDFWAVVRENKDEIQQLTFSFSTPNLLNLRSSLNEDLKTLQKEYNATETSIGLSNPAGNLKISPESKLVKEGVEYITKGGGEYKLKIRGNVRSSRDKTKHKAIDIELDIDLNTTDKQIFIRTLEELTKL